MWPREVFDIVEGNRLHETLKETLKCPGVYVLYRDDQPYYIGQAKKSLFSRLHAHANRSTDRYFTLWNYFSAFSLPEPNNKKIAEIEGILIAAIPMAVNSANPRIPKIKVPLALSKILTEARRAKFANLAKTKGAPAGK